MEKLQEGIYYKLSNGSPRGKNIEWQHSCSNTMWSYDGNCGNKQIISEYIEYQLYREKIFTGLINRV